MVFESGVGVNMGGCVGQFLQVDVSEDRSVQDAERAWEACMRESGYRFERPPEAVEAGFLMRGDAVDPSQEEVALAVADAECRLRSGIVERCLPQSAPERSASTPACVPQHRGSSGRRRRRRRRSAVPMSRVLRSDPVQPNTRTLREPARPSDRRPYGPPRHEPEATMTRPGELIEDASVVWAAGRQGPIELGLRGVPGVRATNRARVAAIILNMRDRDGGIR